MLYLETKDLRKSGVYHIKNNYAKNLDELWFNNSKLIDIEEEWAEPTMLTFLLENGKEIVIDGDFVSKTSGEHKSDKRYQIIEKKHIMKTQTQNTKGLLVIGKKVKSYSSVNYQTERGEDFGQIEGELVSEDNLRYYFKGIMYNWNILKEEIANFRIMTN